MTTSSESTTPLAQADIDSVDPEIVQAEMLRQRTYRRWVFGIGGCIVAMVVLRLIWGFVADWRLNSEIEKYRSAGEPLLLEDFMPPVGVRDEENAAIAYRKATATLVTTTGTKLRFNDLCAYCRKAPTTFPEEAKNILEANRESLSFIREARDLPKVDWGYSGLSHLAGGISTHVLSQRQLSRLVLASVVNQHNKGNDAEAVESLLDAAGIAENMLHPGSPTLIDHLASRTIDQRACNILEDITPTLEVHETDSQDPSATQQASRGRVNLLIRLLLDESRVLSGWQDALNGERATTLHTVQQILDGKLAVKGTGGPFGQVLTRLLLFPEFRSDAIRMMRYTTSYRKAGLARNWFEANRVALPDHLTGYDEGSFGRKTALLLSHLFKADLERSLQEHFRILAMRRMAATALAIRLYEIDHGQRPISLEELVPAFLDSLPEDPFAEDGRTFGYRRDDASPYLYSVGSDGVDDKGELEWFEDRICHWKKDMPFFLNGDRACGKLTLEFDEQTSAYYIKID